MAHKKGSVDGMYMTCTHAFMFDTKKHSYQANVTRDPAFLEPQPACTHPRINASFPLPKLQSKQSPNKKTDLVSYIQTPGHIQ